MKSPTDVIENLWRLDREFLSMHKEHSAAVDTARVLWGAISLPLRAPPQMMKDAWFLGQEVHKQLIASIPNGPEAVIEAAAKFLTDPMEEMNSYVLMGFELLQEVVIQQQSGFLKTTVPPPLTQQDKEDAIWLCARLASAQFSYLCMSPYWIKENGSLLTSSCDRLVRSLRADSSVLSLGGRLGLRLCEGKSLSPNIGGSFSHTYDEIRIFRPTKSIFAHEWMHALEKISRKSNGGYSKVYAAIKIARFALRTMSQDHLAARRTLNLSTEKIKPQIDEVLSWFLVNRADQKVSASLAPKGVVCKKFLREFIDQMVSIEDGERRKIAMINRLSGLLAVDQDPISNGGVEDVAKLLQPSAMLFSKSAKGLSAFEINSRRHDMDDPDFVYWANTSEMLARACECYVLGHSRCDDVLEGSEYERVMAKLDDVATQVRKLFPGEKLGDMPSRRMKLAG